MSKLKAKTRGKKGFSRRIDELVKRLRQTEEAAEELRTENALLRTISASLKSEIAELEEQVSRDH